MNRLFMFLIGCMLVLVLPSCDESVNPSTPFQPRMVIYSVLRTDSDTQYVRVYSTYDPPDNDPSNNVEERSVTDATVTIASDSVSYQFQKTIVQRGDTSGYTSNIVAYSAYPFMPARGKTYRLRVSSPTLGTATATATVPGIARITVTNFYCLTDPYDPLNLSTNYWMDIQFSGQTYAFVARIYVDYLVPTPKGLKPKRREIPIAVKRSKSPASLWELIYPTLRRKSSARRETQSFPTLGWRDMLEKIIAAEDGDQSRFVQAVCQVVHFDMPLYNYYGVAHYYNDRYSTRLDESDYTNISGGTGLFGCLAVDTTASPLPEDIFAGRLKWPVSLSQYKSSH